MFRVLDISTDIVPNFSLNTDSFETFINTPLETLESRRFKRVNFTSQFHLVSYNSQTFIYFSCQDIRR
jgi:hypothetical protein